MEKCRSILEELENGGKIVTTIFFDVSLIITAQNQVRNNDPNQLINYL